MEKKITVYIVKTVVAEGETAKEKPFPTKSRAKDAVELLADFGIDAEVEAVKRVVTLA